MLFAVGLFSSLLGEKPIPVKFQEDVLRNLGMLFGWCPTEDVKAYLEPIVDFGVDLIVFGAQLLRCSTLFQCFRLCRSTILVRAAYVQRRSPSSFVIPLSSVSNPEFVKGEKFTCLAKTSALKTLPTMFPR